MKIAVIPARGGSKRIPGKNIKLFFGKPIISYTIEAAIQSNLFDKVIVSTDDLNIASIANSFGAETPFVRPSELSTDFVFTVPVIKHAIKFFISEGVNLDTVCCLSATAPMLDKNILVDSYNLFKKNKVRGYVFSATPFPFPIQRAFSIKHNGLVEMNDIKNYNVRSQDLIPMFYDACQFYWGSPTSFLSEKFFYSNDSLAYILPKHLVQDIDTLEDWNNAELIYKSFKS